MLSEVKSRRSREKMEEGGETARGRKGEGGADEKGMGRERFGELKY